MLSTKPDASLSLTIRWRMKLILRSKYAAFEPGTFFDSSRPVLLISESPQVF